MRYFFILLSIFFARDINAQVLPSVEKQVFPATATEKLFVHTDKDFYLAGEVAWFKIYAVDDQNRPADISRIAYAELIDQENRSLVKAKIALSSGAGHGSFFLPLELVSGNYVLRAYTSWMKNLSPERIFEKQISVINSFLSPDTMLARSTGLDFQLFPEGGSLVEGLQSRVAFKLLDSTGAGLSATGFITNRAGDTLVNFRTLRFGMGSFNFTPRNGERYTASAITEDGRKSSLIISSILSSGIVMRVTQEAGQLQVKLSSTTDEAEGLRLKLQSADKILFSRDMRISGGQATSTINNSALRDGVNVLTLLDTRGRPVAERLVFKKPAQKLAIKVATDKPSYVQRAAINLDISVGQAKFTDLSVAVHRIDEGFEFSSPDIYSYLWLNSELRGWIESPEYYFSENATDLTEATDNLMLTHGWRKFEYHPERKLLQPERASHRINGKVFSTLNNQPASGIPVFLTVPGKPVRLYNSVSDSEGQIVFDLIDYFGNGEIIVQVDRRIDSSYRVEIEDNFSTLAATRARSFSISRQWAPILESRSLDLQIQNLYSADSLNKFFPVLRDTAPFFRKPHYSYWLDDYKRFTSVNEVLMEYVTPATIRRRDGTPRIEVFNAHDKQLFADPLILIDGVPVFNSAAMLAYDTYKLQRIDVVNTRFFHGPLYYNGIVSFTTYQGDLDGFSPDPNALILGHEGMQLKRVFYSPQYDNADQRNSRIPDHRNLLFWEPELKLSTGSASLRFFSADQNGKFLVKVQGIDAEGKAGSQEFIFRVEE